MKIGCTLSVRSCECDRSFSVMKRLQNWLRRSMKTDQLTSLALMTYDEVTRLFFQLHPMKIYQKT